jgi:hypothetical protein
MLKEPLDTLLAVLADFEQNGTREEKKSAIAPLQRLAKKLEIQSLELHQQRLMLTIAEIAGDKETLQALRAHSQFPEITEWCSEILLNAKRQPRTLPFQRIQL